MSWGRQDTSSIHNAALSGETKSLSGGLHRRTCSRDQEGPFTHENIAVEVLPLLRPSMIRGTCACAAWAFLILIWDDTKMSLSPQSGWYFSITLSWWMLYLWLGKPSVSPWRKDNLVANLDVCGWQEKRLAMQMVGASLTSVWQMVDEGGLWWGGSFQPDRSCPLQATNTRVWE